jgi:dipeptide/tripeptide permease
MSQDTKPAFSRAFWTANVVELLERAAWYGVFIALTLYLSRVLGYSDIEAAMVGGVFSAGLYLLPTFSGALADKMGFRNALLLAFGLLTIGYASMWVLPTALESAGLASYGRELVTTNGDEAISFTNTQVGWHKWLFVPVMLVIMVGGSFIKSVITGTVARETTAETRAKGYSIFYAMVNLGAFGGKTLVKPLRLSMGDDGLIILNLFAATMTAIAFGLVFAIYRSEASAGQGKSIDDIVKALKAVLSQTRLVVLIVIITGFWMVQHQLYATMPKYVLRMAGEGASPSWYANVNPFVVVITVGAVTSLMRKTSALVSMTVGMFIMPFSALIMAGGNLVGSESIVGMHPVAFMMVAGIAFQGLAESFISPRFLEYFSLQAPEGEEGLYLGFSHLHSFLAALLGFGLSGFLLEKWCPDPRKLPTDQFELYQNAIESGGTLPEAYANAHNIWLVFVAVAAVSAVSLVIYGRVVANIDSQSAS